MDCKRNNDQGREVDCKRQSWRWAAIGWLGLAGMAAHIAAPVIASGNVYPVESIRLVVPFGRDGATDLIFREIASHTERGLASDIEIVNVPGAAAIRGATAVREAKPDGYTILGTHQTLLHSYLDGVAAHSHRDLAPVALLVRTVNIATTWAGHPVQRADQIAPYIRSHPGVVRVGVIPYSTADFFWRQLLHHLRVDRKMVQIVHFPDSASQVTALLAHEIDFAMLDMPSAGELYRSETLLPLGVAHSQRLEGLPDALTLEEQGIDMRHTSNRGLFAPKGTPPERLAHLADIFWRTMQEEELAKHLELEYGSIIDFRPLGEFEAFLEQQLSELRRFVRD